MTEPKCDGWQFFSEFLSLKTTKTLNFDMFRPQPLQKVHLTFGPTLVKYQQRLILLSNFWFDGLNMG